MMYCENYQLCIAFRAKKFTCFSFPDPVAESCDNLACENGGSCEETEGYGPMGGSMAYCMCGKDFYGMRCEQESKCGQCEQECECEQESKCGQESKCEQCDCEGK